MKCIKCQIDKNENEFSFKNKTLNKRSNICKTCHKQYRHEHYLRNKDKVKKQVKKYKNENKEYLKEKEAELRRKKSGRNIESICKLDGCKNTAYISKNDIKENRLRYCSMSCSSEDRKVDFFKKTITAVNKRANTHGYENNLTKEYLEELYNKQGKKCAITNIPLVLHESNKRKHIYEAASLDRINSDEGYIEGNVQWVILGVNYMKSNNNEETLIKTLNLIFEHYKPL